MNKDKSKDWLGTLVQKWGLEADLKRQRAVFAWERAVGELARLAKPLYVAGKTLHLAVPSHVAASELRLLEGKLIARLSEVAPESGVKKLRFHVVPQPVVPRRPAPEEPTKEDWEAAERDITKSIPNGLRTRLVRIAAWARARDRAVLAAGGRRCPRCGVAHLSKTDLCPICSLVEGREED